MLESERDLTQVSEHIDQNTVEAAEHAEALENIKGQLKSGDPPPLTFGGMFENPRNPEMTEQYNLVERIPGPDGIWTEYNQEVYGKARREIIADMLTRCVFEVDGLKYQFVAPSVLINKRKYNAHELLEDPRLLRHLVVLKSGVIKQIS